jgi:phosphatidylglycerophosphatase A
MSRVSTLIATLGGLGRVPFAPGTVASLAALPFAWLLASYGGSLILLAATMAAAAIGTWACHEYARGTNSVDPSECVADELAGQWLTFAFAPLSLAGMVLAFLLFRLFDVLKPWPIPLAERLEGGVGIVADDIVAALMAGLLIVAIRAVTGIG